MTPPAPVDPVASTHGLLGAYGGVLIRRFALSDLEQYRHWLHPDREWHDWDGPYFPKPSAHDVDAAVERLRTGLDGGTDRDADPPRRAVVALAEDPATLVGTVSWYWESEVSGWRRMGIGVYDPATRGRGVGTAALRVWTDHLFATTDAVRLDFATWSGNERMLAVGRRLGFVEEARFREAREVRERRYDSVVMGVLRRDWPGSVAKQSPSLPR